MDTEILDKGYTIFRRDRKKIVGRGVLLEVKNNLSVARRHDLETDMEMLCVEVNVKGTCKILLTVFYRPPNSNSDFIQKFSNFLYNSARISKSLSIIVGDFNFPNIEWIANCGFTHSENSD